MSHITAIIFFSSIVCFDHIFIKIIFYVVYIFAWDLVASQILATKDMVANSIGEGMKWIKWAGHFGVHSPFIN